MEHALLCRDTSMIDDPIQAPLRAMLVGCVLAVIIIAGCAVLAYLRPLDVHQDASVILAHCDSAAALHR